MEEMIVGISALEYEYKAFSLSSDMSFAIKKLNELFAEGWEPYQLAGQSVGCTVGSSGGWSAVYGSFLAILRKTK